MKLYSLLGRGRMGITSFPRTPRLVNRFKLGADPEFTFQGKDGSYIYAENLGLTTLTGFGCDMSGRQAEIRAYPSRFALEVVASIADSLRWMGTTGNGATLGLNWQATAYNGKDGCGGHIHFGRRRPQLRELDTNILDSTTKRLLHEGVFNGYSFRERQTLAPGHYGKAGDIRITNHGYEYRTPSTPLSSPWLTYFTLVINKLMVYHGQSSTQPKAAEWFIELLKLYEDKDDDAAIALSALRKFGLPKESKEDFKGKWGVSSGLPAPEKCDRFFPSMIKGEDSTCRELFRHFMNGLDIPCRWPKPTWGPYFLPKGFQLVNVQPHTLGHLPDVGMNLISKDVQVSVKLGDRFKIDSGIPLPIKEIREALSMGISDIRYNPSFDAPAVVIKVPTEFNKSLTQCKLLHDVLSNTELFPVCKAENFSHIDWSKWDNLKPATIAPKIMQGKVVAKVEGKKKVVAPPPVPQTRAQQLAYPQALYGEELAGRKQARPKPRVFNDFDEGGIE